MMSVLTIISGAMEDISFVALCGPQTFGASSCHWQYIYIYVYVYIYKEQEVRVRTSGGTYVS